jgi:hypothetical protein
MVKSEHIYDHDITIIDLYDNPNLKPLELIKGSLVNYEPGEL